MNYNEIKRNVNKINPEENQDGKKSFGKIQKIMSTPHFISIAVRFPGKTKYFALGRGSEYSGFWIMERHPASQVRVIDKYLEYLRKYLSSSSLVDVRLNEKDKLLEFETLKGEKNFFYFFWKGKDLYFAHIYKTGERVELFASWKGKLKVENINEAKELLYGKLGEVGFGAVEVGSVSEKDRDFEIDKYESLLLEGSTKKITKKKRFLSRKIKNIEIDYKKVLKWKDLKSLVEDPNWQVPKEYKVKIEGIRFKFESNLNEWGRKNLIYEKVKSLRNAESLLEKRLEDTKEELIQFEMGNSQFEFDLPTIVAPVWITGKAKKVVNENNRKIDIYQLTESVTMAVGHRDVDNDYLRTKWAKKDDLWFHIDGYPSAHLIIKVDNISKLNQEHLDIIGSLLADYSSLSLDRPPLMYTQVKNLKGIKGQKGGVTMKKQRYISVNYCQEWKERIARDCV